MQFREVIKEAINGHRRIEITYQGKNDASPSVRVVDPWVLGDSKSDGTTAGETALVGHQVQGGSGSHIARYNFSGLRDVRITDATAEVAPDAPADPANWGSIHAEW